MNNTYKAYLNEMERDACGIGFVANINGEPSRAIVTKAITVLVNLMHRGGSGDDALTGDGAGVLLQIPDTTLRIECEKENIVLPDKDCYGTGMFFMPRNQQKRSLLCSLISNETEKLQIPFLGWRAVPTNFRCLGAKAQDNAPYVTQCFVDLSETEPQFREQLLYLLRKNIERNHETAKSPDFHVISFSHKTIVYKGLMLGNQLTDFYPDLQNNHTTSAIAVIHQRYSTNTFPSWKLAQPFRYLAHNGEINTLKGNLNFMKSRESRMRSPMLKVSNVAPLFDSGSSDSANLDAALELLLRGGRDISHSMMMLVPQAWGVKYPMGPDLRGFFEYHAGLMEPWDGPAALSFTDGVRVGALLDRNGLRPARYCITSNGMIVLASEAGVLKQKSREIIENGSLRPGEILIVDTDQKIILKNEEVKGIYARKEPYRRWVEENKIVLHGLFNDIAPVKPDSTNLINRQMQFGYSQEDVEFIIRPMAENAHEPIGSMGADIPLAVFSHRPQLLYAYFKQLFAQVTNPPIDPIREELVMSLMTFMGNPPNILVDTPTNSRLIKLPHPILSNEDMERLRNLNLEDFKSLTLPMHFCPSDSPEPFENAISNLCDQAEKASGKGKLLLILSDRNIPENMAPLPALLTTSAVNQRLIATGARTSTSLIIETGEAREVHHMAVLLGYGATAINPYLAFETIAELTRSGIVKLESTKALENYVQALCKGLLKIMSKMGISTLRSYRSAQVFESVGVGKLVSNKFFKGTPSRIAGIELTDIHREVMERLSEAKSRKATGKRMLPYGGKYRYRKDAEHHLWNPGSITKLQQAARTGDYNTYKHYSRLIDDQTDNPTTIRGTLSFTKTSSISIDEVEPVEQITRRFVTSAMSFGSISREAHETLAVAMNRLGAASNSGEGGEDPKRYKQEDNGDSKCSRIKQVASGRFGVTAEYLRSANEIQIKMAQGAKPGEGGQLPGYKVNDEIARVRHSTPGVTLISPPPHHDIYSIEDIKQLIFDLKNINPQARISVKLVSEQGVGTIAAGVAKAKADMILISGCDGGTGAAPLSSISNTGIPWEIGLTDTHKILCINGLRSRVKLQVDGQMKTGKDVVVAALMGADEFGFASAPLIVCGCVMLRNCHKNTCSTGVATQDPVLRNRFTGKPEFVVNYFRMLAMEVREILASLGHRSLDEIIGRTDFLCMNKNVTHRKAKTVDLSSLLSKEGVPDNRLPTISQDHQIETVLDRNLIQAAQNSITNKTRKHIESNISNTDRATGTMLSGEITAIHGSKGLPEDTIYCVFKGSAGQSFGAFAVNGLTLELTGEANDYLGKGLSGAKIIVKPPAESRLEAEKNVICGNVLLYGATTGEVYINGQAGERFAVRNSGVTAVVEGIGDHGCEYMTGGQVVVLGPVGVNFAAGMSGGLAYIYDPDRNFDRNCNLDTVDLELLESKKDIYTLNQLIQKHLDYTQSEKAKNILDNWKQSVKCFIKVFPIEYRKALGLMSKDDLAVKRSEKYTE